MISNVDFGAETYRYVFFALSLALSLCVSPVLFVLSRQLGACDKRAKWQWFLYGTVVVGIPLAMMQFIELKAALLPFPETYDGVYLMAVSGAAFVSGGFLLLRTVRSNRSWPVAVYLGASLFLENWFSLRSLLQPIQADFTVESWLLILVPVVICGFLISRLVSCQPSSAWLKVSRNAGLAAVLFLAPMCSTEMVHLSGSSGSAVPLGGTTGPTAMQFCELVAFALLLFLSALVAARMNRRVYMQTQQLASSELQHRMAGAINDQRVVRLQNEALTAEIREREMAEARLRYMAFHDSVTGLHNRAHFMEALEEVLGRVSGAGTQSAAVIYIDLDNFKSVNDMFGHRAGDLVLIEIAARLRRCARGRDALARLQGDEFTLLFENLPSMEQVWRAAQRILSVIEEPIDLAGAIVTMTASVGLCEIHKDSEDAADVLRAADIAMYRAKHGGGARCVLYDCSMHQAAIAALQAKVELKAAVEREEFVLYYQPLVKVKDASIYGMEALIRWNHPKRGIVGPGAFIQLAEDTGHICAIGSWVLRQACVEYQKLREVSATPLLLSLNVSSRQLDEAGFLSRLAGVLDETGMDPRYLQLEITESVFLKEATRIGGLFGDIRKLGVRIAFDDFGTGYSSLSYLERYPIDTLKIDQSFVQHMRKGSVNSDIVRLVIELARVTGMAVTAEGVETLEQAEALLEHGCDVAQGYLYSRPVTLAAMIEATKYGLKHDVRIVPTLQQTLMHH